MCQLSFDEMIIKRGLSYNQQNDRVEGYANYGEAGSTSKTANHAFVFMIKGLYHDWKQTFSYYLTEVRAILL